MKEYPHKQRWDSNLGRLVCPRVWFSFNLMVWIVQRYDPWEKVLKNRAGNVTFKLDVDTINQIFRLRKGTRLFKKLNIRAWANMLPQNRFDRFFQIKIKNTVVYPCAKHLLYFCAMDFADMINMVLGMNEFLQTAKETLALMYDFCTYGEEKPFS